MLLAAIASAQIVMMQPSPEIGRLEFLVGEWSVAAEAQVGGEKLSFSGRATTSWNPQRTWLETRTTVDFPGLAEPLQTRDFVAWNRAGGRYEWVGIDDQSTAVHQGTAAWDERGSFVMEGHPFDWPDGRTYRLRRTLSRLESGDVRDVTEMSVDGGELKVSGVMIRRRREPAGESEKTDRAEPVQDDAELNGAFEALEWLAGDWQAEFRPAGENRAAPTMKFEWGDAHRSFLRMTGTQPTPEGGLEPEYESMLVWHPVRGKFTFMGAYRSAAGRVVEDGDLDLLQDGGVRLNMRVHYPAGAAVPFTDGLEAGPEGHTLEFRRTFHREGADGLRGIFRIKRGDGWENPHPELKMDGGYPWRRVE